MKNSNLPNSNMVFYEHKKNYSDVAHQQNMISTYSSLKSSDKELTQYRKPVCVGPSGNT